MTNPSVSDIKVGEPDGTGAMVHEIYGMATGRYAVYRNDRRVMMQFADNDDDGVNQRAALTQIIPVRSDIEALIDRLKNDKSPYQQELATEYSTKLGRSLLIALQGNVPLAQSRLAAIHADMVEDCASDIRTRYLLWAVAAVGATLLLSAIMSTGSFTDTFLTIRKPVWLKYWYGAGLGSLGALFSIALQLRARAVRIDSRPWDNISDAVLRIFIGAIYARSEEYTSELQSH